MAASTEVHRDSFAQQPDGECEGFRSRAGETLVRPPSEEASVGFALSDLRDCEVRLLSPSTALWIRGLRNTTVFAVPLPGFVYISDCHDCTFVLGSRQLRIHTSQRVDFYVHASSHPIIEHCTALRFAPYPPLPPALGRDAPFAAVGIAPEHNQWQLVDDFDWLKASHSPNWAELPETERVRPAAHDGA